SFANKLTDKRYAEFVKAFNFAEHGEKATSYNVARDTTIDGYTARATVDGLIEESEAAKVETAYFRENIGKVESIDDLRGDERLLAYARRAYRIEGLGLSRRQLDAILSGGVSEPS